MGESSTNINALFRDTLPAWPPLNRKCGMAQIDFRPVPKRNIFLVIPGKPPTDADLADHAALCAKLNMIQELHTLGEPLPPEKCDLALVFVVGWMDTVNGGTGLHTIPGEVARLDMQTFEGHAEASLGAQSRIVRPNLGLVE